MNYFMDITWVMEFMQQRVYLFIAGEALPRSGSLDFRFEMGQ